MTTTEMEYNARIWRTSADPAEMVRLCGGLERMDRERLVLWVQALRNKSKFLFRGDELSVASTWMNRYDDAIDLSAIVRADLLRCCVPPPFREQVVCPECGGRCYLMVGGGANRDLNCRLCHGSGAIPAPLVMDPRWLTSTVIDMARVIAGCCRYCNGKGNLRSPCEWCASTGKAPCGTCKGRRSILGQVYYRGTSTKPSQDEITCKQCDGLGTAQPQFDRMPYLAEALCDAGCDFEPMIDHCRQGLHCDGCWVRRLILDSAKAPASR